MAREAVQLSVVTRVLRTADLVNEVHGEGDVFVCGVTQDSREVTPGDLFLAWKGDAFDAHDFVRDAEEAGAAAAVVEQCVPGVAIPQICVHNGRRAAALAADAVMGSPWAGMFTAAITGTNGKTTTAALTRHLLGAEGAASVGTLGLVGADGTVLPGSTGLTTPGPVQIARTLRTLADQGVSRVVFEASSHALTQHRLDGVQFDAVAFTNLSRDHLEYHGTLEGYADSKLRLAERRKPNGVAVVNHDEPAWRTLSAAGSPTLTYGSSAEADLWGEDLTPHALGTRFVLATQDARAEVALPLLGDFNVENALAAAGIGTVAGMTLGEIALRLSEAPQIPGRLEVVTTEPFRVLIDFAHTPAALESVLATLRPLVSGRLIVLFGAGGDRDPGKRPLMGQAVANGADLAILTSDNPRSEDPDTIIDGIVPGMGAVTYEREVDRAQAIALALDIAQADDLVLLAGKGHEAYQVTGRGERPFDEAGIVRAALAERGSRS
jgi:UDP-N-acetylmuramoyl-L-alanyl-D-glutamate--2,6-diaminopimelate ligase